MKSKKRKITILISLLSVTLIWNLIFYLPFVSSEVSRLIHSNPITNTIEDLYDNFFAPQICIIISFINLCYAIAGLHSISKISEKNKKQLVVYWLYAIISLSSLIINCISFNYVFSCLIAG